MEEVVLNVYCIVRYDCAVFGNRRKSWLLVFNKISSLAPQRPALTLPGSLLGIQSQALFQTQWIRTCILIKCSGYSVHIGEALDFTLKAGQWRKGGRKVRGILPPSVTLETPGLSSSCTPSTEAEPRGTWSPAGCTLRSDTGLAGFYYRKEEKAVLIWNEYKVKNKNDNLKRLSHWENKGAFTGACGNRGAWEHKDKSKPS